MQPTVAVDQRAVPCHQYSVNKMASHEIVYVDHTYTRVTLMRNRYASLIPVIGFLIIGPSYTAAQQLAPARRPTMHAVRASGPIKLDGLLDEAAWRSAPVASDFMQSYPEAGGKPTDSTQVRVLYDNDALYVGVRMFDANPKLIAAQLARRDAAGIYSDWVHVIIGSYHDRRTAFRFSVNPVGVKTDVLEYNDNGEDANWDAVWDVATRIDSLGWTAEYRIPFSQLRFTATTALSGQIWDMQVMRDIARRNERDSWAPWTRQSPGFVSAFGEIDGLIGIPTPSRLEVVPYVSARDTRAPGLSSNPYYRSNDTRPAVGGDLKYGLPNGLTLTATVNPDFGQVEVDPAVVNLTQFETFFPEKRPFFLEGADILNFGAVRTQNDYGSQHYFYSRRIGRQPQRSLDAMYVDAPDQTPIVGAAKLTGKAGPWAVGALDAVTSEQTARFFNSATNRGSVPIEPLTNYFVGRVRRDLNAGNTFVGGMITATNRSLSDSTLASQLRRGAYLGGIDFEHSWSRRQWIMTGFAAGSRVEGTPQAIDLTQRAGSRYFQRPDAQYVHLDSARTSLEGYQAEIAVQRTGSVFGSIATKVVSPGFEINDIGFQSTVDYRVVSTLLGYQNQTPGKLLRTFDFYGLTNNAWNFGNTSVANTMLAGGDVQFNNLWSVTSNIRLNPPSYDERLTRGGPLARAPLSWEPNLYISTDSRWPIVTTLSLDDRRDRFGANTFTTALTMDARPASYVHASVGPTLTQQYSTDQYVRSIGDPAASATFGRRYVFANLRQSTLSLDARVDWTFTPTLTLQVYAQPFISAGRYSTFKELKRSGSYDFSVYGKDVGTIVYDSSQGAYNVGLQSGGAVSSFAIANPDFNIRSLHGDAVLRWEYKPASTLFFVWQQQRSGFDQTGEFAFQRDAGAIFRAQPTNVFLVKLSYWIGR